MAADKRVSLNIRIPRDLSDHVTRVAYRKKVTRTDVVVEALRIGLNKPAPKVAPVLPPLPAKRKATAGDR